MSIKNDTIIERLYRLVLERKKCPSDTSYISTLLGSEPHKLHAKLVEEALETVEASGSG